MKTAKGIYQYISRLGLNKEASTMLNLAEQERIRATNQIAFLLFCVAFPYTFIFSLVSLKLGFPVVILELFFFLVLFLNTIKRYLLAKMVLILTANLGAFSYAFILGVPAGVHLLLMAFPGLSLIIFNPEDKKSINTGIMLPIVLQIIVQFVPNHLVTFGIAPSYVQLINKTAVFAVTLIIVLYIFFFLKIMLDYSSKLIKKNKTLQNLFESEQNLKNQFQNQAKELENANEQLQAKAEIDKELETAKQIQKNILPEKAPVYRGYSLDHFFMPARQVSGDYYDYFPLSATKVGILIADIVGKGIPASLMMIAFKGLMHHAVTEKKGPAQTCEALNKTVFLNSILGKHVPIIYGVLDTKNHTFTYVNAGHEPGWLMREGELIELREGGMALGAYETELFEEETINLNAEDRIVLFTDGVTDVENVDKKKLGIDEALKLMLKTHSQFGNASEFVGEMGLEILNYMGGSAQADDVTIVSFSRENATL